MKHISAVVGRVIFVSGVALVGTACARDRADFQGPPEPPLGSREAGAPEAQEGIRCSRDLKKVLFYHADGREEIVAECAPDFGCGDGACVEACRSAELSKGSIGCSFATLPPDETINFAAGSCFAAIIANTWDRPVTIHAALGANPLDIAPSTYYVETNGVLLDYTHVDGALAPGKVAIVFLAERHGAENIGDFTACPPAVVPALREDPIAHKTARTRAFRLTTDAPVSAYAIWPYGGANSYQPTATLLLPISSWDIHYIAVSTWFPKQARRGLLGSPTFQVIAAEDDTEVRMRPNVDIDDGDGVLGSPRGQTQTWTLARGDVLQITQPQQATGSPIAANKPIGLFGGSECLRIPSDTSACDVTQQQIPPLAQWGSEYALVPYRSRVSPVGGRDLVVPEIVIWRFVGAADGTNLTYDPARPTGAPETLEAGQVLTFTTSEFVTVRSQDREHPFYAAVYMTGGEGFNGHLGDPDFVNVVPSDQFLDRYIFFADHTYQDTTLTIVRRKTRSVFHPVTLECAGEITDWKSVGEAGEYEFAWVQLTHHGQRQNFPLGTCGYGRHEMYSDGLFSVTVWGMDRAASYGYPGGQGSRPLSDVKGPPVN